MPKDRRGTDYQKITMAVVTAITLLGGGAGGTAWYMQRPPGGDDRGDVVAIAKLEKANEALLAKMDELKEKRLGVFEGRLGKIERWQLRYGIVIDRIAEESLGVDEARRVKRTANRAADAASSTEEE